MIKQPVIQIPLSFEEARDILTYGSIWLNEYNHSLGRLYVSHLQDCHALMMVEICQKLLRLKWRDKPKKIKLYQCQVDAIFHCTGKLGNHIKHFSL